MRTAIGLILFLLSVQAPALGAGEPCHEIATATAPVLTGVAAHTSALRISRPVETIKYFALPESTMASIAMLEQPVFCPVLLCHGTCNHREGPCTLRTFDKLLSTTLSGCCAPADSPTADGGDQCGSSQCCE